MTDVVLEKRVTETERNLDRISEKLDQSIEQDNDRLSRLEDWLIQYAIENKQVIKELRQSHKKHDEEMAEFRQSMADSSKKHDEEMAEFRQFMAESRKKHDEGMAEFRQSRAESRKKHDEGMAEFRQSMAESSKKHDEEMAESKKEHEAGFRELRKIIADSRKELGQISHRLGTVIEDLVAPSLPRILGEIVDCPDKQNILINVRQRRRHPTEKGKMLEIDAIADCGNYALINETKSQLTPEKVKEFLNKLAVVRDYFLEYQHYTIMGCVSSLYVDASLIEYASRQGLLVLATGEGLMKIQNEPGFTWKMF